MHPFLLAAALFSPAADSLLVSPAWLAAHQADPDLVILEVAMERDAYDRGHLPGARWLNPHLLIKEGPPGVELPSVERIDSVLESLGISDRSHIVYYGDTWMAPRVFLALEYVGLGDRTALLDGGLSAWREEKRTLVTEVPAWTPGRLTRRLPHSEIVVDQSWLRAHLDDGALVLVDGRSPGEYTGTDHSEQLPRFGHIPGAANLPWEQTFTREAAALDGTPSRLKSPEALRQLLASAGVREGSDLITYCTVGLRASHLYFIARYLGLHPRIYDGSMSEWSRKPNLPMVAGPSSR
jgi:thiosulfate/3-mercaptopyruvate sulfurtransferase